MTHRERPFSALLDDVTDDVLERVREAATELLSNPVIEDVVSVRVEEEQA